MLAAAFLLTLTLQTPRPVTLTPTWARGDDADTLVSFSRLTPSMVGVGPDDRVYLLDVDRHRVVVLDAKGVTQPPIGRNGNGPGELARPVSLVVSPRGSVFVWDFARLGFSGWSPAGAVLPTMPFQRPGIPSDIQALGDTLFYFSTIAPDSTRLIRFTPSGWTVAQAYARPPSLLIGEGLCGLVEYRLPPLFSPSLAWTSWGSDLVLSHGPAFEVRIGAGPAARVLAAPVAPRQATRQMAIDLLGPERIVVQGQPACKVPAERIVDAVGMAKELPAYRRLVAVSPTTLWAVRYAVAGEATVADVFDRRTGYRGTIRLGKAHPVAFLHDGRLLSLETTEDDVPVVVAYRVAGVPR